MLVLFTWRVLLISPDITVVHTHPVGDEPGTAILFDATIVAAITLPRIAIPSLYIPLRRGYYVVQM